MPHLAVRLDLPRPLTKGKKAPNLYQAAMDFTKLLPELKPQGVCLSHYVADRAALSSLTKLLAQRHRLHHVRRDHGQANPLHRLLDWVVITGCSLHDIHRSFRWGLAMHMAESSWVSDVFCVVEAVRHTFDALKLHIFGFVQDHLQCHESIDEHPGPADMEFWPCVGVDASWMDVFQTMQPFWHDDALHVIGSNHDLQTVTEDVCRCLLYLCRFQQFTESRWLTVGTCCRFLAGAFSMGLEKLVARMRDDPLTSQFHLAAWDRPSQEWRKHVVIAAVSSHIPDAALTFVLADDRLCGRREELRTCISEELAWLQGLGPTTWSRLAALCADSISVDELKEVCLLTSLSSAGYIADYVLRPLEVYPWCLAEGDVVTNLSHLNALPAAPDECVAAKLYGLLHLGTLKGSNFKVVKSLPVVLC